LQKQIGVHTALFQRFTQFTFRTGNLLGKPFLSSPLCPQKGTDNISYVWFYGWHIFLRVASKTLNFRLNCDFSLINFIKIIILII
jgi:hypothetical protein